MVQITIRTTFLPLTLKCLPKDRLLFVDTQHYIKSISSEDDIRDYGYSVAPSTVFSSSKWNRDLAGLNHIPICGMIIPKEITVHE